MTRANRRSQPKPAATSKAARKRLAGAIVEIMTNETVPAELRNSVHDFVVDRTNKLFDDMRKDPVFIERALESIVDPAAK